MQLAIISDVHANLAAFEAVLKDIDQSNVDKIICCGDLVGYGPDPKEVIALVRERGILCSGGNHDKVISGEFPIASMNPMAASAIEWTKEQLSNEEIEYLKSLPYILEEEGLRFVHGSIHEPQEFNYLNNYAHIARDFELMGETEVAFCGHTHIPFLYMYRAEQLFKIEDRKAKLADKHAYMVNVGSVGQPRDRDRRASYVLYNTVSRELQFKRIEYDLELTMAKMEKAGLPALLISRLGAGW